MRPRITFRDGRRIANKPHWSRQGAWIGEYAKPEDDRLPSELRDIVQTWRAFYADAARVPRRQDLRATLRRLALITDEDAQRAVRAIDGWTSARLATASLKNYRQEYPAPAQVPGHVFDERSWSPKHIRALALSALDDLRYSAGGRPRVQERDIQFVQVLLDYWQRTERRRPTFDRYSRSSSRFVKFVEAAFLAVGRKVDVETLYPRVLVARKSRTG